MTTDTWQFVIGALALADGLYLARKALTTQTRIIWAAVLPRLFVGSLLLFDAFVTRPSMEPLRTINYIFLALLFFTANATHFAEWRQRR